MGAKRTVLFVTSTLQSSGPITVVHNLVQNLDRSRFTPLVLTLSPEPTGAASSRTLFERLGVGLHSLGLSRPAYALRGQRAFRAAVAALGPAVIHSHGLRADIASSRLPRDAHPPLRVCTVHNDPFQDYPLTYGRVVGGRAATTHLRALQRLDAPVACSGAVARTLHNRDLTPRTIQNGVDTEMFYAPTPAAKAAARRRLGLRGTVYVSAGHLNPRKDPETVLQGFLRSEAKTAGCLVFLGDGELRAGLEHSVGPDDRHRVRFLGNVADVADVAEYLRAADVFVSASTAEGLPNAVLEALACGLPVLLSDIGPHREILGLDRRAGRLFGVRNAADLSLALNEVAGNPAQDPSVPVALVEAALSAKRMTEQYEAVYEEAAYQLDGKSTGEA